RDVLGALARSVHHLGQALAQGAVRVDPGVPRLDERQVGELLERRLDLHLAAPHLREQRAQPIAVQAVVPPVLPVSQRPHGARGARRCGERGRYQSEEAGASRAGSAGSQTSSERSPPASSTSRDSMRSPSPPAWWLRSTAPAASSASTG